MSWQATSWAKKVKGTNSSEKLVLMVLADYADPERWDCWPSQRAVAEDCNMSVRTVRRSIKGLEHLGYLLILRGGNQHRPALYRLLGEVTISNIRAPANLSYGTINVPRVPPVERPSTTPAPATGVPLGVQEDSSVPDPRTSDQAPAVRFVRATKRNEQVAAIIDLFTANGVGLTSAQAGHVAAVIGRYGHGQAVVDEAMVVAGKAEAGDRIELWEGRLRNGAKQTQRRGRGRGATVASEEDIERAKAGGW